MKYNIKYIRYNNRRTSIFNVNGVELSVKTKSERELEQHLDSLENILNKNLRFNKYEDLLSDTFKVFEYYSIKSPDLVKNYFNNLRQEMEMLNPHKESSKLQFLKYLSGIPFDNHDKDKSLQNIFNPRKSYTLKILNSVFQDSIARRNCKNTAINIYSADLVGLHKDTSIGVLTYLGVDNYMHNWRIGNFEIRIGNYILNFDVNELLIIISNQINSIHKIVTNARKTQLIDFTNTIEIQILNLYYEINRKSLIEYLNSRIKDITKERIRVGVNQFGVTRFIYTLCKNNDSYEYNESKLLQRINHTIRGVCSRQILELFQTIIEKESIEQIDYLVKSNTFSLDSENWRYYFFKGNSLLYKEFNFNILKNSLIKHEVKLYYKCLLEDDMLTKNTLRKDKELPSQLSNYKFVLISINYLIVNYNIFQTSDLSAEILDYFLKEVFATRLNGCFKGGNNACLVESVFYSFKAFYNWVVENSDRFKLSKPNPHLFSNFTLNSSKIKALSEPTSVIPEIVIEQFSEKMHYLKPDIYKRMLLIYLNCPRRFDEIQKARKGCISPKRINGVIQKDEYENPIYVLTYIEYKKMKNADIERDGLNYKKYTKEIDVNHIVAREIKQQLKDVEELEKQINSERDENNQVKINELFVIRDNKTKTSYRWVRVNNFVRIINSFIKAQNIRNSDGKLWPFSARQTRKTSAYFLMKNGANFDRIKHDLGHEKSKTTQEFYIEINKILLADSNTDYLIKEFDSRLFDKQKNRFTKLELTAMFKHFCLESRIIYYCRKMLGVCTIEFEQNCPYQINSDKSSDDFPCANCPFLLTSKSCRDAWVCIKTDQEVNLNVFNNFMKANNLEENELRLIPQYKNAEMKYINSMKIIEAIDAF